jgi:hypothetical protein
MEGWKISRLLLPVDVRKAKAVMLSAKLDWQPLRVEGTLHWFLNGKDIIKEEDGLIYFGHAFSVKKAAEYILHLGHDGGANMFVDGKSVACMPTLFNPCTRDRTQARVSLAPGTHEIVIAFATAHGRGWGISFTIEALNKGKPVFPVPV